MSDFESADFIQSEPSKPEREGLPSGYRMRADAHYVESLSSPRGDGVRERARAPIGDGPSPPSDRRVFDQLAEDVSAIEAAAAMLSTEASPLARRVGLDLIRAQTARAAWLLRATALTHGSDDPAARPRAIGDILDTVRERTRVECRLMSVALALDADDRDAPADDALVTGLTGAVLALLGLLVGAPDASIRVRSISAGGALIAVEVSADGRSLSPAAQARFFDTSWVDRPGGWLAAQGAGTIKASAERAGAHASIAADRRGCTIRWSLRPSLKDPLAAPQ